MVAIILINGKALFCQKFAIIDDFYNWCSLTQAISPFIPFISYEDQQVITRLCVQCGLLLMQYGAESVVVVDLTKRLGRALGVVSVECALSFNALTLTTLYNGRCITTTRHSTHQGINVAVLVHIGHIVMDAEKCRPTNLHTVQQALIALDKMPYPAPLVACFVGLSCACFAYLHSQSGTIFSVTLIAATLAMSARLLLIKKHFNAFIAAMAAALVATFIGSSVYFAPFAHPKAEVAVAASILLLVPSFPIINALSDVLKGYITMGVGRFLWASMLSLSACVGIVSALLLLGIADWGL